MNSTLKAAAVLAAWLALPAAALNHEDVVAPLPPGKFNVACSNVEHDMGRLAQLGGTPVDYWEGNEVRGRHVYLTDILAHPQSAFVFDLLVPAEPWFYPTVWLSPLEFAAIVCYPTPASNDDPDYALPGNGGTVPHMARPGTAPRLISAVEYAQTLGLAVDPGMSGPQKLPVVVYSHGLAGSPLGKGYLDIATELAANGYMVAAVFHADARYSPVRIESLGDLVYTIAFYPLIVQMQALRPLALLKMTDRLLGDGAYAAGIDRDRIGGFGASLGGQAMALLAGAHMSITIGGSACRATEQDERLRAVVAYVPYSGYSFLPAFCDGQEGASHVRKPYLGIGGTFDITAPIGMTERAVKRMGSSRYLVELLGGQHELRPQDAGDVLTWMVTFLNAYLDVRSDPTAMARFIRMGQVTGGRVDNMIVDVHQPFPNQGGEVQAVEFYHPLLDHYFLAAGQDEIDILRAGGGGGGWQETRETFKVWPFMPSDTFVAAAPVCRFYGALAGGPNSHFFTASPPECQIVKQAGGWYYEGIGFYIRPVGNPRVCPAGWLSVNRAYNNGFARNDSNHRFTTSDSTIREMGGKGWAVEGTVMCARP